MVPWIHHKIRSDTWRERRTTWPCSPGARFAPCSSCSARPGTPSRPRRRTDAPPSTSRSCSCTWKHEKYVKSRTLPNFGAHVTSGVWNPASPKFRQKGLLQAQGVSAIVKIVGHTTVGKICRLATSQTKIYDTFFSCQKCYNLQLFF